VVQLKYFGDSRDFFKYDLVRAIFEGSRLRKYVFVPMLTEHREDNEGKKPPRNHGDKLDSLLGFINGCNCKSLKNWESWVNRYADSYTTLEPVDEIIFSDQTRELYWKRFERILGQENALIFVDPDTGLETGSPSYLRKAGKQKYLLNYELKVLMDAMDGSSAIMLYQHLSRDKRRHEASVAEKLKQVRRVDASVCVCAYREEDLAFLFIAKSKELHAEISRLIENYHASSVHQYKSLHV
jgi:hypothetical protein